MKRLHLMLLLLSLIGSPCMAQVGDVTKGSRDNKEGTTRRSGGDGWEKASSGIFAALDILDFLSVMIPGQSEQLAKRFDQPYRVSLEAGLNAGYYGSENTLIFLPSFRGNWGLLSTYVRANIMQDRTGQFQTLDWQVLQFNIVNVPEFTLRAGSGFSHVYDIKDTYLESTVELEGHIHDRKINPILKFRWSNDLDKNTVPRFEINPGADVRIMQAGKFRVHFYAGYLYQRYLGATNSNFIRFHFIKSGFNLYFF